MSFKTLSDESSSSRKHATSSSVDFNAEITRTTSAPKHTATTLMLASSSPSATTADSSTALLSSSTPTSTATAAASGSSGSSGMSGGTAAGIVFGVLIAVGAVLTAILFVYRRKKKQMAAQNSDNEKPNGFDAPLPAIPPPHDSASSIRTQRTMSTAPRLSLRPVTQFSPTFAENRKSGGNLLSVAAAAAPAQQSRDRAPSPEQPRSPWERPGAGHAAGAQNPFQDPVSRSVSPLQDPFGNQAAIDAETPRTSATLTANGTPRSKAHLDDFANPAPAIQAAEAAPLVIPAAPIARKEVPAPRSVNSDVVPPSPAWTDDVPPSPGPAPSGPPPMAVPGGSVNGPAPGPNNVHRIQLDFVPSMQDELELKAGLLVRMLHEYDDGWALCVRLDRSQQGVVPRTCLSKHPVKPRTGPPRQGPPGPRMRGPPVGSPMGPGGIPHPRPLTPSSGRQSPAPGPHPGPRSMSPGPRAMSPSMGPAMRSGPQGRGRSHSNAPYAGPPRSMSPGPYGGGPQNMPPPPKMGRPRSNSASEVRARRASPPGPSPMNPNANGNTSGSGGMPPRKPVPGLAL
ncbi:hypothetical protein K491DRAFT_607804 [Lophiostoma macrostomum CBS 122681]|uniref:SH3 domain-containing protein n=1 Tax=Lophiostoma macrostomum CBS 122681 TaxID=1314788 RepID=A0A6A6STP2_9PLEO|nr:hypothetical protein K491DRAFT_607804 [Lophiostoma macrostomum CBS 122681]